MLYRNELHRKLTERVQALARNPAYGLEDDAARIRTFTLKMTDSGEYALRDGEPTPLSGASLEDDVPMFINKHRESCVFVLKGQPPEEPGAAPVVAAPKPKPKPTLGRPRSLGEIGAAHLEQGNEINAAKRERDAAIAAEKLKREIFGE